jgi:putative CocE/NonD family hydrolase
MTTDITVEQDAGLGIAIAKDVMVAMRDGVELATDVYRPVGAEGPVPVVFQRTPYDKEMAVAGAEVSRFVRAGYAYVAQDVRGRARSGGAFDPFVNEAADGEDAIAWLAEQPWCDGQVAMLGQSYVGATQWMAAGRTPAALKAISPQITSASYYEGWSYQGGALELGFLLAWTLGNLGLAEMGRRLGAGTATPAEFGAIVGLNDRIEELYRRLPLTGLEELRDVAPYFFDWLEHPTDDAFWKQTAPRERYDKVAVPSLNIGGWYDCFLGGTLANYRAIKEQGGDDPARRARLVVGPWAHGTSMGEYPEQGFGLMANSALADLTGQQLRFFDRHLRGIDDGLDDEPPVKVFVMGANVWRDEQDWPLPDTKFTKYFLDGRGRANTAGGDGVLTPQPPAAEAVDAYLYDPRDPVPTMGGGTFLPGFLIGRNSGPRDQRAVEARADVLCFTTEPLERDTEVTGPIELVLHASSSAFDTDFTGKLVDVHPDGRAVILTDGILRARYRESTAEARLLEPGEVYELRIDLWATANVFAAGHRIRLEVSSSNFPRFDRNTNTGAIVAADGEDDLVVAVNRVHHGPEHQSHLVLPIIERN